MHPPGRSHSQQHNACVSRASRSPHTSQHAAGGGSSDAHHPQPPPARLAPSAAPAAARRSPASSSALRFALPAFVAVASVLCIDHVERGVMAKLDAVEARLLGRSAAPAHGLTLPHKLKLREVLSSSSRTGALRSVSRWINTGALGKASPAAGAPSAGRAGGLGAPAAAAPAPSRPAPPAPPVDEPRITAPKPVIFDLSSVANRAIGMMGGDVLLQLGGGAPPPAGVARPPVPLPPVCVNSLGYNKSGDAECYWVMDTLFQREAAVDANHAFCWGASSAEAAAAPAAASPPLLFHAVLVDMNPAPLLPLLYWSFLATQCCDAVLWVWAAPGEVLAAATAHLATLNLPPAAARRVVFQPYEAAGLWARAKAAMPPALLPSGADDAAAAMPHHTKVRERASWARALVLALHGGVYLDTDVVLLRDWRPLLNLTAFGARVGFNIFLGEAGA